jgi:molecular chaperone GrpE (heat shock protein)
MTVQYRYDMESILKDINIVENKDKIKVSEIISEITEKIDKKDNEYNNLKIRIEENIKNLKDNIYQLFEVSFKNKSELERTLTLINQLNTDFLKIINDIEEYKKITNERIEKLFKIIMITTEKLNIK